MLKFNAELWDRAAVPCIIAPLHRQTALCLHLLEDFLWPMTLFYRRADIRFVLNYKCQFKTSLENWTNTEYTWQPCLFYISGLLWPTSPEGQTHTCLMPQPFSSQWGFSWGFSAAPLWWVQPQESSQLSYPFSETCFETKITNTKSDLSRLIFSFLGEKARLQLCVSVASLTPLPRHQVHQAALLPAAGDGPLLPHVLEHLPAGRSLRVHRWAVSGYDC